MSRILSALRKSEARRRGSPAQMAPLTAAYIPAAARRRTGAWIIAAGVGLAALGAAAGLYHLTGNNSAAPAPGIEAQPAPPTGASSPHLLATTPGTAALKGLHIDVLVYSDDPSARFVLINMQRFREGDLIGPQTRIDRITASDVIIRHQNERLRLAPRPH